MARKNKKKKTNFSFVINKDIDSIFYRNTYKIMFCIEPWFGDVTETFSFIPNILNRQYIYGILES